ncbi:MAG: tRNA (cytidine(34)-2'-O)-methyltransferase [Gammaproteobacteria bacterium]|jgi:tRNA (cytidine/uridine-2'-O-)-methyltransferase|nr:tRNA (uridine(34)/cytosine(34)/5-carboxymethylaminomethyluridine(34)-2'-O)-methyltransferase TrmL [Chromatiales bacterium]MCP4924433.1 tRNA (cytidine(34)-2'-O)-methyltransferase [Gammaproteobacteria bacterium]MDP7154155.1 tRNA (cytidine(34)-2'-O)-methyltransferase [Gammaproteobacteria bacterium]MDP7297027.1 tRNA (cytidine(34)-2'-O)-methyltransferase [Gammaproteobacteria bacterium]MDP7419211.1 tRNA (cytidine(34)-2'-O)-methyltransferase [Gammaproteobacteria bacterium]
MFNLILYEPEIPPNTGNIIRLCANTGTLLHLIRPLGFALDDKKLRRAGLDYREFADLRVYDSLDECLDALDRPRTLAISTRGKTLYSEHHYMPGDTLLYGPETRGLPGEILQSMHPDRVLRIPMQPQNRSLNLANAVAIVLFEAWRQQGFQSGT